MNIPTQDELLILHANLAWLEGDLSWKLHEKQVAIWNFLFTENWKEALFFISRQFGKSYLSCCIAIAFAIRNPGTVVRIAAPTKGQAYDIVNDQLSRIANDAPKGLIKPTKSDLKWKVGRSEIRLGSLERAHIDTCRGANASLVILEEGGFVKSDEYQYAFRSVLVPQVTKTKGKILHVTTPSEEPEHFIHMDVLPRCSSLGTLFRYTIHDNPFLNAADIVTLADLVGGQESMEWKREYLVQIVRDGSVVCCPGMKQSIITLVPMNPMEDWFVTGDWGGSQDKTVIKFSYCDRITGRLRVGRELKFDNNTSTKDIVDAINNVTLEYNLNVTRYIIDAPGQLLVDLCEIYKFNAVLPVKPDWHVSLNWTNVTINADMIEIDPSCTFTIRTLWAGTFNKQKTDYARTKELGHMDAIASLNYCIRAHMMFSPNFTYFDPATNNQRKNAKALARYNTSQIMHDKFANNLPERYL